MNGTIQSVNTVQGGLFHILWGNIAHAAINKCITYSMLSSQLIIFAVLRVFSPRYWITLTVWHNNLV